MKTIEKLLKVMSDLRAPNGCPWDREQDHMTLRFHAVEEAYELMDAIEAGAVDFIVKPFQKEHVRTVLDKFAAEMESKNA